MYQNLFAKIRNLEQRSNGKQKILARYFLSHFNETSFQTVAEVANKARVSESTVIRFSRELGFKGFLHLKDEFQGVVLSKLSPSERLHVFEVQNSFEKLTDHVFEKEIHNIKETQKKLELGNLNEIAHRVVKAKKKYIIGLRASAAPAYLFGHLLNHILSNVITILIGDTSLFEGLRDIDKEDILIGFSFPRYTKRTVEAIQFARKFHTTTVAITDTEFSPASQLSDFTLIAPAYSDTFSNSYTACSTIINMLITLITHINKDQTEKMLAIFEDCLKEFDFFEDRITMSLKNNQGRGL